MCTNIITRKNRASGLESCAQVNGERKKAEDTKKNERHCPTQEGNEREESRSLVHQQKGHISSRLHWEDPGEAAALGDRDRLCVWALHTPGAAPLPELAGTGSCRHMPWLSLVTPDIKSIKNTKSVSSCPKPRTAFLSQPL